MRHRALACIPAVLYLFAVAGFSQISDGNITGAVIDATGVKTATKTDGNRLYRFNNVLTGRYSVSVSAAGFSTLTLRDVLVEC